MPVFPAIFRRWGARPRAWVLALLLCPSVALPPPPLLPAAVAVAAVAAAMLPAAAEARSAGRSGGYSRVAPSRTPSISRPAAPSRTPSASDLAVGRQGSAEALRRYRTPAQPGPERRPSATQAPTIPGWSPPSYALNSPRRFGVWDAAMLWFLLDTLNRPGHAAFFHNHEDDPGYRSWRAEAERRAETDPELRSKLDRLDADLTAQAGRPRDPNYLPPDTARPTPSGVGSWWVVILLGGVLVLLWRRRASKREGSPAMSPSAPAGTGTIANLLRRKLSGQPYTPSLFRVGMTVTIDPAPFLLAAGLVKVVPPVTGPDRLISIEAVGTATAGGVVLHRLYLPDGKGFFQLHLDEAGQPDECRYFSPLDEITPADESEWGFWLDESDGVIGSPQFQTKDGKVYDRAWNPGDARIHPLRLAETIAGPRGTEAASSDAMLYAAATGAAPPAPGTEYILVAAVERGGQAWVQVAAGMDVNPASLSLA
jgi:hypothetical protein